MININPYDYMLKLRNNKVLFSYMTECFVRGFQDDGITDLEWMITGKSDEGELCISPVVNNLFRISLPILAPSFLSVPMIADILLGLQPTIEGLITFSHKKGLVYFEYNFHINPNDDLSLDTALLLFLKERSEIKEGFKFLIQDFNNLQRKQSQENSQQNEESLNSLWDVMNDIDTDTDVEEDDPENNLGST
jgi:hypothetical protein